MTAMGVMINAEKKECRTMSAEIKQTLHEVRNRLHQIRDYL